MKLSFTTLGCHEWDLNRIIKGAAEYGYEGVDFRGYMGEMKLWKVPALSSGAAETLDMFAEAGLEISCLSSDVKMYAMPVDRAKWFDEVCRYVELASNLGVKYIRVFGGDTGSASMDEALDISAKFLTEATAVARAAEVELVVETHDAWVDSGMLIEAFKVAGFPKGASILWDVHHPYRMNGEDPDLTWKNIGSLVKYTHWKDSYLEEVAKEGGGTESRTQLCLMGKGDIPLRRIMEILVDAGYDGWYTLEWERKWHPEIDAPEVAFPQYIKYIKDLLSKILK